MSTINNTTTMAILLIATAVVLIGGLALQKAAFAQPTEPKKVLICHNPEIDPSTGSFIGRESIIVSAPSVAAHVQHGDYIGACRPPR